MQERSQHEIKEEDKKFKQIQFHADILRASSRSFIVKFSFFLSLFISHTSLTSEKLHYIFFAATDAFGHVTHTHNIQIKKTVSEI